MPNSEKAVYCYFALYVLYVLVPLIPAVIIFKLFPDTKVAVNGPFQNLTVNAGGAFAAYFVTVLVGYFLVRNAGGLIAEMVPTTWKVHATVVLEDSEKRPLRGHASIESLSVEFKPPLSYAGSDIVHVTVPVEKPGEWPTIVFAMNGFETERLDLKDIMGHKKASTDAATREITLNEAVHLTALAPAFSSQPYSPSTAPLAPLSAVASEVPQLSAR